MAKTYFKTLQLTKSEKEEAAALITDAYRFDKRVNEHLKWHIPVNVQAVAVLLLKRDDQQYRAQLLKKLEADMDGEGAVMADEHYRWNYDLQALDWDSLFAGTPVAGWHAQVRERLRENLAGVSYGLFAFGLVRFLLFVQDEDRVRDLEAEIIEDLYKAPGSRVTFTEAAMLYSYDSNVAGHYRTLRP